LFSWDDVPGNDSRRLLKFLKDNLKIEWMKNAEIEKSDNGETIIVTKGENSLSFKLNKKENKVTLEISGGKTYEYILKEENGKLNIYLYFNSRMLRQFLAFAVNHNVNAKFCLFRITPKCCSL
jgi:hypothetical protein